VIDRGHFHAVRFYEDHASLCRIVANFLREGLTVGQPALIIATNSHVVGIIDELRARGLDVDGLIESRDLVIVDAKEALESFMNNGIPDPEKFERAATAVLDLVRDGRSGVIVRAYGEMVDVLWKQGRDVAAIQLEMLWNRLARSGEFSLMCGYAMGNFYKDATVKEVCRQHTHLVHSDGTARVSNVDTLLVGELPDVERAKP
jgi:DcmR-like sensory protein